MRGLAAIERNGTTQARMISDLLDMSRLNLGKLPLTFVTIDPVEEIVASVNAMRPVDGDSGPCIEVRSDAAVPRRSAPTRRACSR